MSCKAGCSPRDTVANYSGLTWMDLVLELESPMSSHQFQVKLGWLVNIPSDIPACCSNDRLKHECRTSLYLGDTGGGILVMKTKAVIHLEPLSDWCQKVDWWAWGIRRLKVYVNYDWIKGTSGTVLRIKVKSAFPEYSRHSKKGSIWFSLTWEFLGSTHPSPTILK